VRKRRPSGVDGRVQQPRVHRDGRMSTHSGVMSTAHGHESADNGQKSTEKGPRSMDNRRMSRTKG
jgi:hypothetical protein